MRKLLQRLLVCLACALAAVPAHARDRGADGRFDERRSTHFVLLEDVDIDVRSGPHGGRAFERAVLEALEQGYDRLDDLLGLRPRRPLEVVVYDPVVFDRTFAGLFRFPAAGFYGGTIRVRGDTTLSPQLRSTLHHELVHAALDGAAPNLVLPGWLHEGLAEWFQTRVAGRRVLAPGEVTLLAQLGAAGRLLPIEDIGVRSFAKLDGDEAAVAYLEARALVAELERLGGAHAPAELVARVVRTGNVDHALHRTVGLDSAGLEASLLETLGVAR